MSNRLAHETSPYLRQHAHNPVDWYPWGPEALARARELDRPIFLSIGYSACHWCHVMERESFEDEATGKMLNDHFISIKVDREERPDLDQIYMMAVQALTRQGGWPMSMFLTPDLHPFYGGTYFPPRDMYGRPSFQRVLLSLAQAWRERRGEIDEQAKSLSSHVQDLLHLSPDDGEGALDAELLKNAGRMLARAFDQRHGGFGQAPKFPHPMELRLLLRLWRRFDDHGCLDMAKKTLDLMARGGMYDQLGGGFHRYSTDAHWLVPHFEKMLYDNALLVPAYLEAFQITAEPFYKQIAEEILGYVQREMTSPEGPFFSTQDADSEGVEGKFFVWKKTEVDQILGPDAELFCEVYDITPHGNWEESNIPHLVRPLDQEAKARGINVNELKERLDRCRQKLFEVRSQRIWPGLDDKILTSWNGLMIGAFAQAASVLDQPKYAETASRAADYLLKHLRAADGRLLRTGKVGSPAKLPGYLEDYSYLIDGLVSLYEATFEPRWIETAEELAAVMIDQFWDDAEAGFFFTGKDHEALIARTKDPHDNATPSGNAMAVTGLLRLAKLTGRADLMDKAERTLNLFRGLMSSSPMAAGQMLCALDFYLGPVREIAVVGLRESVETQEVLKWLRGQFEPSRVLAWGDGTMATPEILANRPKAEGTTTYVCQNFVCDAPIVGLEGLKRA